MEPQSVQLRNDSTRSTGNGFQLLSAQFTKLATHLNFNLGHLLSNRVDNIVVAFPPPASNILEGDLERLCLHKGFVSFPRKTSKRVRKLPARQMWQGVGRKSRRAAEA